MGRPLYRHSILIQELHIKMLGSITVVVSFMVKRGGGECRVPERFALSRAL